MNSRSTRLFAFVLLLMAIVLVSAITVTVLWAKPDNPNKPDNTGKPEEPLPDYIAADFKIWIGTGNLDPPEDVVLQSFVDPVIDYLFVDDWNGGRWLPLPPKKGNKPVEGGWSVFLGAVNLAPGEEPEYCGTYDINDQDLIDALIEIGFYPIRDKDVLCLMMTHYAGTFWEGDVKSDVDYWRFTIQWLVGTYELPENGGSYTKYHVYQLEGETEKGPELEAEYNEITDTWTIFFNNVDFRFEENTEEPGWVLNTLWEGQLSFTVEIQRILP